MSKYAFPVVHFQLFVYNEDLALFLLVLSSCGGVFDRDNFGGGGLIDPSQKETLTL